MYPSPNPIFVQVGTIALHWYGLIITVAILSGTSIASRYVIRHDDDGKVIWDILLWILVPAIVGARLYYVFIQSPRNDSSNGFQYYMAHPLEIIQIWQGGMHIYGALIFGAIALFIYQKIHKAPLALYLDGIGLGLAVGQAIGCLGNFMNQQSYGPPTTLSWGLHIDLLHRIPPYDNSTLYPASTLFQPLFLYEMLWDLIGFALLLWLARSLAKRLRTGDLFLLYLIWVPLGHFFLEFLRTDSWFFSGTLFNISHPISAILVIGSATTLFRRHRAVASGQKVGASEQSTLVSRDIIDVAHQETVSSDAETIAPLVRNDRGRINLDAEAVSTTDILTNSHSTTLVTRKKRYNKQN